MQHECIMQQTSVRVQNWRWYHSWSFPLFFLANSLLSILLTSLMRNKTRSHKNDIPIFNGSVISSSVSLIPVCGSSLSLCWNSFQLNCGVFLGGGWFGQLKKSIDTDIPKWPLKGHSVYMLFHFLQWAPKGPKSLQAAASEGYAGAYTASSDWTPWYEHQMSLAWIFNEHSQGGNLIVWVQTVTHSVWHIVITPTREHK